MPFFLPPHPEWYLRWISITFWRLEFLKVRRIVFLMKVILEHSSIIHNCWLHIRLILTPYDQPILTAYNVYCDIFWIMLCCRLLSGTACTVLIGDLWIKAFTVHYLTKEANIELLIKLRLKTSIVYRWLVVGIKVIKNDSTLSREQQLHLSVDS